MSHTPEKTKVAFIGLGIMGAPMARNLIGAGYDVTAYNRSQAKVEAFVEDGGKGAPSVAEAVREADVVITMVPASPEVEEVVLHEGGVLENVRSGALIIDMSSITPQTSVNVAKAAALKGVDVLDAPVSGGEAGAVEGALSIMVGGEQEVFDAAKPVFEALGRTIVLCGPHGSGQTVKAANQLIVAVNIEAVAEAVVFLEKSGVDLPAALDVLGGGLAGSTVLARKKENILAGDFRPGFKTDLHHKDMGIVTDAARDVGAAVPAGALLAQLVAALRQQGDGGLDHSALVRGVRRLSGEKVED
ncbi:2-hydroxy-3-oxopropionate reductase [Streptomyces abyssalis]|uniref:2-hydroxy-3-oxopropionate reductase n=1 Tax=Streptomyces abyssalis TaxID=933944 RepID=A0A1E7JRZ6_9ACTN|nr:2-hydroxy-3-oxopropionate reductase [Streptomyces abyssalis]OEU91616.1 2-hydroxy-3-oxopropionate reductase [Streptomyces abyssalis]OEU94248.1 2-hydroxy-3-oxopropionate reductase [Streptomyces abyssalis]OEV06685.1 2-hydroxy-3-oxopropionate reductase [Streptomyces nanshensis]